MVTLHAVGDFRSFIWQQGLWKLFGAGALDEGVRRYLARAVLVLVCLVVNRRGN